MSSTITASGSVQPAREVSVSFTVSGTLATVDVAVGDTVKAGQKLGSLDTSTLNAQLSAAYSSLANAKSNLTLANAMLAEAQSAARVAAADPTGGGGNGSSVTSAQQQVNSAKNSVSTASATVTEAQENLAATTLTAPTSGLVIAVNGGVGEPSGGNSTASGTSGGFVTIADVATLTITANIAEADIADVTIGQIASVAFPALTGVTTTATVTAIAPTATASNSVVTYATTITLDAIPDHLRLGQTANVTITTASSADDALYIPSAAITTADGVSTVKVVAADGTVKSVTVQLGIVGDLGTEITSGLSAGETIVLGTAAPTTTTTTTNDRGGFGGFGTGSFPGGGTFNNGNQQGGNR